jgi:pantoate--beta-alanine ligase
MRTRIEPLDIATEAEALARPHFFGGVATVCAMLFNIVQPDVVAFGQKDALQCAVIQNLVDDLHMPIEVVIADTVRTASGLAMSTRNKYLTPTLADAALVVPSALRQGAQALQNGASLEEAQLATTQTLHGERHVMEVEYVAVADRRSGKRVTDVTGLTSEAVISCAVKMEDGATNVRLIDNICVQL